MLRGQFQGQFGKQSLFAAWQVVLTSALRKASRAGSHPGSPQIANNINCQLQERLWDKGNYKTPY